MDLEILFWLLFLLAPVLSRWIQRNKQAKRGAQEPARAPVPANRNTPVVFEQDVPGHSEDRPEPVQTGPRRSPFEEALRQIQEALEEAREETDEGRRPAREAQAERRPEPKIPGRLEPRPKQVPTPVTLEPPQSRAPRLPDGRNLFEGRIERRVDEESRSEPVSRKPSAGVFDGGIGSSSFFDDGFEARPAFDEPFHETVHSHLASDEEDLESPGRKKKRPRTRWQQAYVMSEVLGNPRSRSRWSSRLTGGRS